MDPSVRLFTIPHSTYCEAARWALQAARVPFREECWLLGSDVGHKKFIAAVRATEAVHAPRRLQRSDSMPVGAFEGWDEAKMQERRNSSMVPCALIVETGELLGDSFEICAFAAEQSGGKLAHCTRELQHKLDLFGAACRNFCYANLSSLIVNDDITREELMRLYAIFVFCVGDDELFSTKFRRFEKIRYDALDKAIIETFRIKDFHTGMDAKARAIINETFDMVAEQLRRTGKTFLGGSYPGIGDIIFASHASWLLFPPEFGHGVCTRWPPFDSLPPKYQDTANGYKATAAGRLALEMYAQHRNFGPNEIYIERPDPILHPWAKL